MTPIAIYRFFTPRQIGHLAVIRLHDIEALARDALQRPRHDPTELHKPTARADADLPARVAGGQRVFDFGGALAHAQDHRSGASNAADNEFRSSEERFPDGL